MSQGSQTKSANQIEVADAALDLVSTTSASGIDREQLLPLLKALAHAIVRTFGPEVCEVVIHDLADLEHSIVWIEGDVTHRRIGGAMTDLGLEMVRAGKTEDLCAYRTYVDGKTLQSSSVFLRDAHDRAWGSFCINFNVTAFQSFQRFLESFAPPGDQPPVRETFTDDIEETLQRLLDEGAARIGKPVADMNREERLDLIRLLEQKGAFLVRRAVPVIANALNVSRFTVYNYLTEIRGDGTTRNQEI